MIPNYRDLTDETAVKNLRRTLDLLDEDDDVPERIPLQLDTIKNRIQRKRHELLYDRD